MSAALEDSMDELEAAARLAERDEIIALLESLKTEWRPQAGGNCWNAADHGCGRQLEPSLPTDVEVRVLERAIAKIRARK